MNGSYNNKFKQPELSKYGNVTYNPIEHLNDFKSKLILHARDGALMCKLFPIIL